MEIPSFPRLTPVAAVLCALSLAVFVMVSPAAAGPRPQQPPAQNPQQPDQQKPAQAQPSPAPADPNVIRIPAPKDAKPPADLDDDSGPPDLRHGKPLAKPKTAHKSSAAGKSGAVAGKPGPTTTARPTAHPAAPVKPPDPHVVFIEKARERAGEFTQRLPNYMCQQVTTRYQSDTRPANWRTIDVVTASVVYDGGEERYQNVRVDGRPTKSLRDTGGTWSTGEFGTIQLNIFAPQTEARFSYDKDSTAAHLPAAVYDYDVPQERSNWQIKFEGLPPLLPHYDGRLWIDKQSARVLRIEMEALDLPDDYPLDAVETSLDYDWVRLGEGNYLLPVRSENLACQRGRTTCTRNVIEFRNYKKFGAESNITYDK